MRRRHRVQAVATSAVLLAGLAATPLDPYPAADAGRNTIPKVAAPAAGPSDAEMLRRIKLRASRAQHRRELRDQRRQLAHAAHLAALARERAASALVTSSSVAWAHTRKAIGVANCESGPGPDAPRYDRYVGDAHLRDPNGHYGKWQFAPGTADSVGAPGAGVADLPEAEQDYYAWLLWRRDGWGPWECATMV